ncbi:MAG: TaqI-like C-terminal specificity domain-containing protein [Candidatus Komeilibacteria bacterium]|nr:TaqI-like C-terminal specificity domain-containing protein [Candidatus Komeilibacteria bacterium]
MDIFDRYNFTVKEDEPLEKEVAVDPEMLGKVFENLLEVKDRKSKGTYYTPREIVHYMCEQSLINYLATELESKVSKEDLEELIKFGENVAEHEATYLAKKEDDPGYKGTYESILPESIGKFAEEIDDKLATIKVCDPAIGSGAFPVGMMSEIVKARTVLSSYIKNTDRTVYGFKRDCIQNSLYGVDLDPGAVEIAKLRLWLSLIVDEDDIKQIKPLPNLDYKIMQGNSLIEDLVIGDTIIKFNLDDLVKVDHRTKEMKNLFEKKTQEKLFRDKSEDIFTELKKLHSVYFEENNKNKKLILKQKIDEKEQSFITAKCDEEIKRLNTVKKNTQDEKKIKDADQQIEAIQSTLQKLERESSRPFFLWKLHFSEVFQENGGFDVVIANPPYVTTKYGKISDTQKKIYSTLFESAYDKLDLYVLFFEMAIKISKTYGFITFISPWNFVSNFYSFKIRKFLLDNVRIKIFNKLPPNIFNGIIVDNIISVFQKDPNNSDNTILFDDLFDKSKRVLINQDKYKSNDKYVFDFPKGSIADSILEKMKQGSELLGKIALNYIGIMTGGQKEMISDSPIFKNSKPILSGKDIFKWFYIDRGNYVNFDKEKIHSNDNEKVYLSDKKILLRKTGKEFTACLDTKKFFTIQSLYNIVIKDKDVQEEYLLALLNSKLFTYIYSQFFITNKEVFPYVKRRHLDQFPIKKILPDEQRSFTDLVEKISEIAKLPEYKNNSAEQAKVKDLEHQIDTLVYKLYDLTEDEIRVVES